jgi:hypothetical protein
MQIAAINQREAGPIRRETGMRAASTRAHALFAASRPASSGEWFSMLADIMDSIRAVPEGLASCCCGVEPGPLLRTTKPITRRSARAIQGR